MGVKGGVKSGPENNYTVAARLVLGIQALNMLDANSSSDIIILGIAGSLGSRGASR